jgi:hypothetical protein
MSILEGKLDKKWDVHVGLKTHRHCTRQRTPQQAMNVVNTSVVLTGDPNVAASKGALKLGFSAIKRIPKRAAVVSRLHLLFPGSLPNVEHPLA